MVESLAAFVWYQLKMAFVLVPRKPLTPDCARRDKLDPDEVSATFVGAGLAAAAALEEAVGARVSVRARR